MVQNRDHDDDDEEEEEEEEEFHDCVSLQIGLQIGHSEVTSSLFGGVRRLREVEEEDLSQET
jgi:hypothetical protein